MGNQDHFELVSFLAKFASDVVEYQLKIKVKKLFISNGDKHIICIRESRIIHLVFANI